MTTGSTVHSGLIQIGTIPQVVPSQVCFTCGVCCHFPEQDSFLRPYFTEDEIRQAVASGLDPSCFPDPAGAQIRVVPNPAGEGYLCPAYDPATSHCRIYKARPLDCQIYPLAVMWSPPTAGEGRSAIGDRPESSPLPMAHSPLPAASGEGPEVVLGWDAKCPFLAETGMRTEVRGLGTEFENRLNQAYPPTLSPQHSALSPALAAYADRVAKLIETNYVETYAAHPNLISRFQNDVIIVRSLSRLTARLSSRTAGRGLRSEEKPTSPAQSSVLPSTMLGTLSLSKGSPQSLRFVDRLRLEQACGSVNTPLAAYAFAPHYIWRDLFAYSWVELDGHFCLFAEYADGIYMPLPPLRGEVEVKVEAKGRAGEEDSFDRALEQAFDYMRARNRGSPVSRIENIPEEWASKFEKLGYRLTPKDPDYLYRTRDLVALAGDRYKSPRAACNRFEREHRFEWRAYREQDREACLVLYRRWAEQQGRRRLSDTAVHMLRDSESAHRQALEQAGHLGLEGRVVLVDGVIRAYTFGYSCTTSLWCVLLEVSDRTVPGLAQWTFRQACREAASQGYEHVNTMDASGLPELAGSKEAYHPVRRVPSFIAAR